MTSYIAMGHSQASVDSYTRALWHAIHHPNLALDAPSPLLLNWYRHALEWGGWQLRPGANFTVVAAAAAAAGGTNATDSRGRSSGVAGNGTGAAGSRRLQQQQQSGSATAGDSELLQQRRERLAEVVTDEVTRFFRLAAAVQGTELVRSMHATYIGGAYAPPKVVVNTAAADESGDGTKLLVTVIVVPVAGTALLLGVVVVAVVMYMRRHNRDMLGRVRAPRAGPDTTLLVSDVQNSTNLWESLDTEVMEEAMAKHHAVFRGLLSKHHGYETATEGDSFILAFCTPTSALCFAADVQLALLAVEWPAPLLEHPDACELMVAVDPAGVGGGGGGGTAASAAAAQQTAAAAAAAHVNSQYGPVSPNGGAGGLAGGSSSSRGLAGMMGTATPSPSGTNQLRAAAGMDSHRLSGHHHSPTSSPLPYQRSFWSNAGQGSLLGPQPVALQGPSSGVGAAGGFAVVGVGAAGFGGGAGGASAAGALHNSRMSGRLRMSAGVGHGSGPGSGLGNGGTAAYGQPFPGSYGPSSNHGPGSYGGGGGGGPNSGPGSRAHSQYGRASNGEGVAPLYGLQNLAGAVAADANNDGAGPASGGGARMRPARAAADDATALAAMYGSGGSGGTGGGGYTGCEGASGRGGAPSHREVAGPVTESTEDDPSGRVQEPQATVISSIAAAAAAGTFPGKDKDASTRTAGVPLGPPSSAGASEYGPPTRQVIDALMRGRFNNLYEPTGSALTVGLSREQTQVAQEVGDYDMATNWRESLAALFPALLAGGLGAFASAADGGGGASMYMRPSVQVSHKRLSVLGLPPMGAGGGKPQTQVCWRGLRVRMGLHSGLDGEEHIIFNKVSMTYKYYGPFADAANATNETVPGGLIALSAAIFDRLKNAHGGGSSSSRIVKSAPDTLAAGVLIIYAGHHQLKDTPPPAPAPAAPKAAPAPLPPQLLLTSPFKSGSARKLLTAATGGAAGGDAAAAAGGGGGLASREPSTVHVSLSTATSPQPRSSSVTAIGAGAAGPAPPSARSSAAKSTATAAAASAAAAMALVMSTAADGTPLYVAVPRALMCRLAHAPPLRTCKVLQQGNWAAPVGLVCIGFMKVVGVTSLLTELPAPAARALSAFQSLVCSRLGAAGGYLLEGGDGLALVAFGNAGCAVGWALDCVEALKEMDWEDELLSHELCEEVYTYFDKPRAGGGGAFAGGVDSQDVGPSATVALSSTAVEVSLNAAATITAAAAVVGEARTASTMRRVHADALRANRKLLYRGLRVKVGMDIGHAVHALGATSARIEYRGKVMNRAARIAGFASTGQVCVSAGLWQAAEASGALLDLERPVVGLSMGLVPLK